MSENILNVFSELWTYEMYDFCVLMVFPLLRNTNPFVKTTKNDKKYVDI